MNAAREFTEQLVYGLITNCRLYDSDMPIEKIKGAISIFYLIRDDGNLDIHHDDLIKLYLYLSRVLSIPILHRWPIIFLPMTYRWHDIVRKSPDLSVGALRSRYLFSRPVTRQVSSAYMSLTSVFGMGTGGPSWQSTRTLIDGFSPIFYVKALMSSNSLFSIALFAIFVNSFSMRSW